MGINAYTLDTWGRPKSGDPTGTLNRLLFAGSQYDEHTGLHELAGHHIDPDTGRFLSSRGVGQHQYVSLAHNPAVGAVATEGSVDNPYNPFSRWGGRVLSWVEEHHEDFRAEYMDGKTLEDVCGGMGDPGQQLSCISNARNVQVGSAALGAIVSTAQGANSLAATGLDLELSHLPGDIGRQARRALISDYRSAVAGMDFLFNGNAHTGSRTGFGYLWDQQVSRASAAWEGDLGAQSRLAQTGFEVGGEIVLAFATGGSSAGVRMAGLTARVSKLTSRVGKGLDRVQGAITRGVDRLGAKMFPNARHLDLDPGLAVVGGPALPRVPVGPLDEGRFFAKRLDDGGVNPSVVPEAGGVGTRGPPTAQGTRGVFRGAEGSIANFLRGIGRKVERNPLEGVPGAGRQGDAFVDGALTEFKSLDPGATSNTIRNVVNNSIRRGGQARNIIIDARGSGLDLAEVQRGVGRAFGVSRGKIDNVSVIGDGFFFERTR